MTAPTSCPECGGSLRVVYRWMDGAAVEWWSCEHCDWLALAIPVETALYTSSEGSPNRHERRRSTAIAARRAGAARAAYAAGQHRRRAGRA